MTRFKTYVCPLVLGGFLLMAANKMVAQEVLREKMFIHTDRNYYQTAEIIWFRIYNVNVNKSSLTHISKLAYVELLDSSNMPVLQGKIRLDEGTGHGSFMVPSNTPTGLYTLRGYTNWMKNFGAAAFFHKEIAIVNAANGKRSYVLNDASNTTYPNDVFNVSTSRQQYEKRQKVTVNVSSTNTQAACNMSVSVYRLDSLIKNDPVSFYTSFSKKENTVQPDSFPFPPEYKGHFVGGKMLNRNTRLVSQNITGYLTVMDDPNAFYNSISDLHGNIKFLVSRLHSADSIIVQTHSYYDRDHQVEIESPFSDQFASQTASNFRATENCAGTVLAQSIHAQVTQLYYENELNRFSVIRKDSIPFYGKEDAHYALDDYTRFSKLEDVFREYVRPVAVTRKQNAIHLSVFNETNRYLNEQQPLVLVDAVPVFNNNVLFSYDPLKIKTIDVVTDKYFRSGAVFPGIIDMATYRGRTDAGLIDPEATVLAYEIVQKHRHFHSPSYETSGSTELPDFRTTVYWNPSLQIDATGNATFDFFTPDIEGEYIISVQGIAGDKVGSAYWTFRVVP